MPAWGAAARAADRSRGLPGAAQRRSAPRRSRTTTTPTTSSSSGSSGCSTGLARSFPGRIDFADVNANVRGHMAEKYVVGVDFGTLSGRAVVVRAQRRRRARLGRLRLPQRGDRAGAAGDRRAARAPRGRCRTPTTSARCCARPCPPPSKDAGVDPDDVVGIATDFTASTPLPVLADGTPLCEMPEFRGRPHAYPKLWKHHAAQAQADRITALAAERNEPWLARYGGMISSEWQFAKALQVLEEDAEVYDAMDRWIEARRLDRLGAVRRGDAQRVHRRLQGHPPGRRTTPPRTTSPRSTSASRASRPTSSSTASSPRSAAAPAR